MANKYIANNTDLQAVANAIREKGGTSSPLTFPDGFVEAIGDIETGGSDSSASSKAVNFIDYDGTVLYSYSESEAFALTELPANPFHSGLTAQGWNWTLAQIKAQLTSMPGAPVWIGQKYITDDGKTRIYCHFETGRLKPYLGLGVNGTVEVDWGDSSNTDTLTGTSLTTVKTAQHSYSNAGDYIITLTVANGKFAFFGVNNAAHILKKSTNTTASINRVYANVVRRVEMGANVNIGDYAFQNCNSLASITIPNGVTSIGNYAFGYCYNLASITIPNGVTSIDSSAFYYCSSLAPITIPNGVTSIGNNVFQSCYCFASITIPNGVTNIGNSAFYNCYGLGEIHFLPITPPTVSASSTFSTLQTDCKIYVPAGSLAAYTSATNYPNSSTYTYIEE